MVGSARTHVAEHVGPLSHALREHVLVGQSPAIAHPELGQSTVGERDGDRVGALVATAASRSDPLAANNLAVEGVRQGLLEGDDITHSAEAERAVAVGGATEEHHLLDAGHVERLHGIAPAHPHMASDAHTIHA